jgi:hypothetical protein
MVTLTHARQCRHRPINLPEIGNFGGAAELLRGEPTDWRKDRRHRVVDPNVDRSQSAFDTSGSCLDRVGIGNVAHNRQGLDTLSANLLGSRLEPSFVASEERDVHALAGKL